MTIGRPPISAKQHGRLLGAFHNRVSSTLAATSIGVHRNTAINYYSKFRAGLLVYDPTPDQALRARKIKAARRAASVATSKYRAAKRSADEALREMKEAEKRLAELEVPEK